MSLKIEDNCISCGACIPECPNDAISEGDPVYIIDPELCTECVGFHEDPQCAAVCPIDECCILDPEYVETQEELLAKKDRIHPNG
ncbi:MAG: YfhL family 4Fe-4S dicluster ferredoxin [Leptospirillum sp.]|nr:YfhL family 4Fe-4S dicluster ferredoxin [Nitrospiraceae bacterium]